MITSHTIAEFKSAESLVEDILEEHPETRDSDLKLFFKVCEKLGCKISVPFNFFEFLYAPETISRVRRKIQNEKCKFLPSEKTLRARNIRESVIHEMFSRGVANE
jgi:hypothetical protein